MTNLTLSIDEAVLRRARIRALEQGTSVNALLRAYLEAWVGGADQHERELAEILGSSRRSQSRRGGRAWSRDELHER